MNTITQKLSAIQQELKAPKSQFNSFGNYKYRSCEDILEAIKPIVKKNNAVLFISDTIVEVGGKNYVMAEVTLADLDGDAHISCKAYAREAQDKKKMDDSQMTGTASSYARKYALNGLFCIDDTKDADTDEFAKANGAEEKNPDDVITEADFKGLYALISSKIKDTKKKNDYINQLKKGFEVTDLKALTNAQADAVRSKLGGM